MKNDNGILKVLQVNMWESPGRRFHGLAITPQLAQHGVISNHLVWEKDSQATNVLTFEGKATRGINQLINHIENRLSVQSMLYVNGSKMMKMSVFKQADLIHLHIIQTGFFSLGDLPKITAIKPTIWTIHGPWATTGHCFQPGNCERWKIGCGQCPDLGSNAPLRKDTTRLLFDYKRRCYSQSKFDVIVASKFMEQKLLDSPLFKGKNIHHIPFGLDLTVFHPAAGINLRKRLNIANDTLIISFRSTPLPHKGLEYIIQALTKINSNQKICLLTINTKGLIHSLSERYRIIELGTIHNNDAIIAEALAASDIFLMPSLAESFGMMAIESMACGTPLIVFDGTALSSVAFAPDVAISVPKDSEGLAKAIQKLIDNPQERLTRGRKGREIAEKFYSLDLHINRLVNLYKKVAGTI